MQHDRYPDVDCHYIPTCDFCGLRWHEYMDADGNITCDLKIRQMQASYRGCVLADAI